VGVQRRTGGARDFRVRDSSHLRRRHEMILPSGALSPTRGAPLPAPRRRSSPRGRFQPGVRGDSAQYLGKRSGSGSGQEEDAARPLAHACPASTRVDCSRALQLLDDLQTSLVRCVRSGLRQQRTAWRTVQGAIVRLKRRCSCSPAPAEPARSGAPAARAHSLQCKEARNVLAGFGSRLRCSPPEKPPGVGARLFHHDGCPSGRSFAPPGRCARASAEN